MAEMIPESIPSGKPLSERRVFDVLQKLPDDYFVYYEPVISERYPDFILICPDLGVLVIEVKGWSAGNIIEANDECVKMRDGDRISSHNNPIKQARDYMFRVMNSCKRHPEFRELCHTEGRYEGNYLFPFGHVVFLSKITAAQRQQSGLNQVFRDSRVMTRDMLDSWESLSEEDVRDEIRGCFSVSWSFPRLTPRQVDILRAAIHPDIVVGPTVSDAEDSEQGTVEAAQETTAIKILDWQQEAYARKIGDGHRVLNGVAGSGKTILLLHRARWLSDQDPDRRILVVCYNRALSAFLKSELKDCKNVEASTFHQWGYSLGARRRNTLHEFGLKVLEKIGNLASKDKYDAILIDEAQDFESSWFQCAVAALKDGEDGDLIIVADGSQGLYRPKAFRWIDVGVRARGRVIPLRKNYRNTQAIMDLAWEFAEETEEDKGEAIVSVKPVQAVRQGPDPLICKEEGRNEEKQRIVALVQDLLQGRWGSHQQETCLEPSEIGIIYPRVQRVMWRMFFTLKEELEELCDVIWLNDKKTPGARDKITEPGLKIQTIDSSKGLQYRAVIFMWADLLPSDLPDSDKDKDRRKLYVGLTRAQDYLAVTYSGESEFTDQLESSWSRNFRLE